MTKRVTMADVAERAGVSKTAVSLVLNDRPNTRLSVDVADRVRAAAAELDYRPNPAARTLRKGTSQIVGFISDEVTITRYATAMIRGALDTAQQHEHTVLIAETGFDRSRRDRAIQTMLDQRPDGLIFALMGARQIDVPEIPADLPVVILNGVSSADHPCVLPAEFSAGSEIAETLVVAGHRRIGLIGATSLEPVDPRVSATVGDRLAGIGAVLARAGVPVVGVASGLAWEPQLGHRLTHQILDDHPDLTALICLNDRLAFGAYQALQERGRQIPDDLSIVSFDDEEIAGYLRPRLTTARIPYEEMGREAMAMLLNPTGDRPHTRRVAMPVQYRESVRPPQPSRETSPIAG
jgi:LacI family transcriptional regulator